MIKDISGLSDDALDELFAKDRSVENWKRPRSFFRIRGLGSSPTDDRGHRKALSLYAAVHGGVEMSFNFRLAKECFDSALWEFLTTRRVSPQRINSIILQIMTRKKLTRICNEDTKTITEVFPENRVLVELIHNQNDSTALDHLLKKIDFDSLTLLIALHQESVNQSRLRRAIAIQDAINRTSCALLSQWNLPAQLKSLVLRLIDDRIFSDVWLTEGDFAEEQWRSLRSTKSNGSETLRRKEVDLFVKWYISDNRIAGFFVSEIYGLPIPDSKDLDLVRCHQQKELMKLNRRAFAPTKERDWKASF